MKKLFASAIFLLLLLLLPGGCKKTPTTTTIDNAGKAVFVFCNPSSAGPDAIIIVSVFIRASSQEIRVFGLEATFDTKMFQFQEVSKGSLTGDWTAVGGNEASPGELRAGGFVGGGTAIAKNSNGTLIDLKFKVTGQAYSNGQQSQICIREYKDDISAFTPESTCATFTLKK